MHRFTILVGTCLALICGPVFAGDLRIDGTFASNVTSGPPLEVNSTALVPNLNADFLDGLDASVFATKEEVDSVYNEILFTADDTFTIPSGVTRLEVTVTGAGGGGGGGNNAAGGGGGGSGLVVTTVVTVTPGESLTADVGAGGLFGGGGGGGNSSDGTGGSGIFAGGGDGSSGNAGAGASGGAGGGEFGGGGGGGPGGGDGGDALENGDPGTQPGAGGGGGGDGANGGAGADGAILVRWVGAPEGS